MRALAAQRRGRGGLPGSAAQRRGCGGAAARTLVHLHVARQLWMAKGVEDRGGGRPIRPIQLQAREAAGIPPASSNRCPRPT